jgi:hypothetical protein
MKTPFTLVAYNASYTVRVESTHRVYISVFMKENTFRMDDDIWDK